MCAVSKWVEFNLVMERSVVGIDQVVGYISWVWSVVLWAVSKWGDLAWVCSVVKLAVSSWGLYSVCIERSFAGNEQLVGYSVDI